MGFHLHRRALKIGACRRGSSLSVPARTGVSRAVLAHQPAVFVFHLRQTEPVREGGGMEMGAEVPSPTGCTSVTPTAGKQRLKSGERQ